jgi:polyisoprenyl-phosphate glycosyltransferase
MTYAILLPIYEDLDAAKVLFQELKKNLKDDIFIIAVDDGSIHQPVNPEVISDANLEGVVIRLKRNLGHQRAIAVGISYIANEMPEVNCIVMDSDGEDRPESVQGLISMHKNSDIDVLVATRKSRVETLKFKVFYLFYKFIFSLLTGRKISFGNFMLLTPKAIKRLSVMQEVWIHFAASILVSRLRVKSIPVDRGARYKGQSKMNFNGLLLHGFRALMVFAEDVLVRVGVLCILVASMTLVAILLTIALKLTGFATPGWFSVALGVLFIVLLQTGALTLISLMLSGVMRGGSILVDDYNELIEEVLPSTNKKRS